LVRAGSVEDTRGRISLDAEALRFTPGAEDAPPLVIPRSSILDVRRLRATPVMRLIHGKGEQRVTLLLYFAEPPPLPGTGARSTPPFMPRKGMERAAAGMSLRRAAREQRAIVETWVRALRGSAA
jgi:hypothetical protein